MPETSIAIIQALLNSYGRKNCGTTKVDNSFLLKINVCFVTVHCSHSSIGEYSNFKPQNNMKQLYN